MSKTFSLHHIVFATKHREPTITQEHKRDLYAYIHGIIKNRKCNLFRINGMADHIHILVDVHPSVAIADLVKEIKQWSSHWLKTDSRFPLFSNWGEGYYAVSLGIESLEACRLYIINQESHHGGIDLISEMQHIADTNGLRWYDDDWD